MVLGFRLWDVGFGLRFRGFRRLGLPFLRDVES